MNCCSVLLFWILTIYHAIALDISKSPLVELNLSDNMLGIHSLTEETKTPPSITSISWYILLKKGSSSASKIGNGCPDDSSICAITKVKTSQNTLDVTDNDTDIDISDNESESESESVIQLFSLNDDQLHFNETAEELTLTWQDITWGDHKMNGHIKLLCDESADKDIFEIIDSKTFIDDTNVILWKNKQFCANDKGDDDDKSADKGMSNFTVFFLILIVIFAGYLVAQAWFNTSTMGSSGDFFNELVDTVIESFSSIPRLIGEIISKITGGSSGSSNNTRGGYSAV